MEQQSATEITIPYKSDTNGMRYESQVDLKIYACVINDEASFRSWIIPYINSYDSCVSKKDFDVFDFLDELKNEITHSKNVRCRLKTFAENKKQFISWWNNIKKDYDGYDLEKYSPIIENSLSWIDKTQKDSTLYLVVNQDAIFEIIDDLIIEHKEKLRTLDKTATQKYNEKRYAKKKELLGIPDKIILKPEERVEHRKASQMKYYEKIREGIPKRIPLTEEQKKENRKLTQKKYVEKMKQKREEASLMNEGGTN